MEPGQRERESVWRFLLFIIAIIFRISSHKNRINNTVHVKYKKKKKQISRPPSSPLSVHTSPALKVENKTLELERSLRSELQDQSFSFSNYNYFRVSRLKNFVLRSCKSLLRPKFNNQMSNKVCFNNNFTEKSIYSILPRYVILPKNKIQLILPNINLFILIFFSILVIF